MNRNRNIDIFHKYLTTYNILNLSYEYGISKSRIISIILNVYEDLVYLRPDLAKRECFTATAVKGVADDLIDHIPYLRYKTENNHGMNIVHLAVEELPISVRSKKNLLCLGYKNLNEISLLSDIEISKSRITARTYNEIQSLSKLKGL